MQREMVVTLKWDGGDFIQIEGGDLTEEATLIIDEKLRVTTLEIPQRFGIVAKRNMQRRAQSIAKSGFLVDNTLRIGLNFNFVLKAKEDIPDVLLQVGHKYSSDYAGGAPMPYNIKLQEETPTEQVIYSKPKEKEVIPEPVEEIAPTVTHEDKGFLQPILGKFMLNLLNNTKEVYFIVKQNGISAEFGTGKVLFAADRGNINIITSTVNEEDEYQVKLALEACYNL